MPGKAVIVTGAGFSAPAKLPIQNKIIEPEKQSILDIEAEPQSIKFLRAFIEVGLYLLYSYGDSYDIYHDDYIIFFCQKRVWKQ